MWVSVCFSEEIDDGERERERGMLADTHVTGPDFDGQRKETAAGG